MNVSQQNNGFSVKAYPGDAKTLLAFNLSSALAKNLAGFTIQFRPAGQAAHYLSNNLQYEDPSKHAQDPTQSPHASINAPIHKFWWVHVPGADPGGAQPIYGPYTYTITPRYGSAGGALLPIDPALAAAVTIAVGPFAKDKIAVGCTRGFTQSQAFVHHFGDHAIFRPKGKELLFDTTQVSGQDRAGKSYTFAEEYGWLGFTARAMVFALAHEVLHNPGLRLDVFAYDLNEPDLMKIFLELAQQGRIRVILDNAPLHHNAKGTKPEDQFEKLFAAVAPAAILRGKFGQFAHDKVLLVSDAGGARKVLTGSTNFSITGFYVNSNHVLVFNDPQVAAAYAQVFNDAWAGKASMAFSQTPEAGQVHSFAGAGLPTTEITFSPHPKDFAAHNLATMAARIALEEQQDHGSVLFAVMGLAVGTGPILPALNELHANQNIFSYGISDTPKGIWLYTPRHKTGVLVTGKPAKTRLPPPFDQVPGLGLGHQVHHKFVVCGFNGARPVVYCGSSNLTQGGEQKNGDNLIAIHDGDIATVFAIEALDLVDHFNFLDRCAASAAAKASAAPAAASAAAPAAATPPPPPAKMTSASKAQQAKDAAWYLSTGDGWTVPYFDPNDLKCEERQLFA